MKVLHVNNVDLQGRRFNGYDLLEALKTRGIDSKQVVLSKLSDNPAVIDLCARGDDELQYRIGAVERRHSMNGLLFPWARVIAETPEFRDADVIHYHLIHNQMVSLLDIPQLFSLKPAVWTFHDAWPLTGHCISPAGCDRWLNRCEECPSLGTHFPLETDCAHAMWRIKQSVFSEIDPDIVVASDYMCDMVHRSPLTSSFEHVHLIPFGIEPDTFLPNEAKGASRRALGIPKDDFVVLVRATDAEFKGTRYALEALGEKPARPTTLLTVHQRKLMNDLTASYNVIEFGWIDDPQLYRRVLSACDVLLMPSIAESFGMMALEAMAASRPVICFEGTALPSVTHAPECGIAVPARDASALRAALDRLMQDPAEARRRGDLGRRIAVECYSQERYLDAMADLYRSVEERARPADGSMVQPAATR